MSTRSNISPIVMPEDTFWRTMKLLGQDTKWFAGSQIENTKWFGRHQLDVELNHLIPYDVLLN